MFVAWRAVDDARILALSSLRAKQNGGSVAGEGGVSTRSARRLGDTRLCCMLASSFAGGRRGQLRRQLAAWCAPGKLSLLLLGSLWNISESKRLAAAACVIGNQ